VPVDEPFFDIGLMIHLRDFLNALGYRSCLHDPSTCFVAFVAAAGPASLVWAGAIAFSWLPRLAHNFARRFGTLAAPFLGFLDTNDSTSAKLHRARRQSGLLQLIEKREANADGGAEFLD
jgi:hypothetical protein